jgi:hypothetical protein
VSARQGEPDQCGNVRVAETLVSSRRCKPVEANPPPSLTLSRRLVTLPAFDDPTKKLVRQLLGCVAEFDKHVTVLKLRAARQRIRQREGRQVEGTKPFGHYPNETTIIERMKTSPETCEGEACQLFSNRGDVERRRLHQSSEASVDGADGIPRAENSSGTEAMNEKRHRDWLNVVWTAARKEPWTLLNDDADVFDAALTDALGETVERLTDRLVVAVRSGDREQTRLIDETLKGATVLGTHAVLWALLA